MHVKQINQINKKWALTLSGNWHRQDTVWLWSHSIVERNDLYDLQLKFARTFDMHTQYFWYRPTQTVKNQTKQQMFQGIDKTWRRNKIVCAERKNSEKKKVKRSFSRGIPGLKNNLWKMLLPAMKWSLLWFIETESLFLSFSVLFCSVLFFFLFFLFFPIWGHCSWMVGIIHIVHIKAQIYR